MMTVYLGGHYARCDVEMSCRQPLKASHPTLFSPAPISLQYSVDGVIMFVFDQACFDCGTGTKCHQPKIAEFEFAGSGLGTFITEQSSGRASRGIEGTPCLPTWRWIGGIDGSVDGGKLAMNHSPSQAIAGAVEG